MFFLVVFSIGVLVEDRWRIGFNYGYGFLGKFNKKAEGVRESWVYLGNNYIYGLWNLS